MTLNVGQLKVDVRKGNVSLKEVRQRRDALRKLAGLPIAVESGTAEEVSFHVPWPKLAGERVVVVVRGVRGVGWGAGPRRCGLGSGRARAAVVREPLP